MNGQALRGLLILVGAFVLCFAVFLALGPPRAEGAPQVDSVFFATIVAGTYSLTSLAAILVARGVLGLFVDFSRPVTFFQVLGSITDPMIALCEPVTPGFVEPPLKPFLAAFWLYFLKVLVFGIGSVPPPWIFVLLALG
ncbi:MAG: hypothetical protein OEN23_06590 [Paracoccaceae bacterium]|nr:hypothetical protein [Paracoccaceae bacterium]